MKWSFAKHARELDAATAKRGRALIREALQSHREDLPDLLWLAEAKLLVIAWD